MKSGSVTRAFALATAALCCVGISVSAYGQTLYTTQDDFAEWGPTAGFDLTTPATPDLDGSTTNGLGNTTNAGGTGTGGSFGIDLTTGSFYSYIFSSGEQGNANFVDALGVSGNVLFDYTKPSNGDYFQLGVCLNYDGHFDQTFGSEADNGDGTFTATVPYSFTPGDVNSYFQFGLIYNSNATEPFNVDNIRLSDVVHPVVPEPTSLLLCGLGVCGLWFWRRSRS
jgi:PEP-CTERM motif